MSIARPESHLISLGIARDNVRALLLLPIAHVAWACQRRDLRALDVLLESAAQQSDIERDAVALARSWLRRAPGAAAIDAGLEQLSRLARAPREPLFAPNDLLAAALWACCAAQLDRDPSANSRGCVSPAARRAVRELEVRLGVEIGELWADVLWELGEELPRSRNATPPRFRTAPESSQRSEALREH